MNVDVSGARVLVVADREANLRLLNCTCDPPPVGVGVVAAAPRTADPFLPAAGTSPEGKRLVTEPGGVNFVTKSIDVIEATPPTAALPVRPS